MDGVINVLKPPGMTSSNVVADLRRICGEKRVGHTGTLDPGAAGVLPVCLGKATRLFDYLLEKDKVYRVEITFGRATDTLDAYGTVLRTGGARVQESNLLRVLPGFVGELTQVPPLYSALKQNGRKLYELARSGSDSGEEARQAKTRTVRIHALDYIAQTGDQSFLFDVCCSRGTYVRTLCEQIAEQLDALAYMSFLLRTRSGTFALETALTLPEIASAAEQGSLNEILVPCDRAVEFLPEIDVDKSWQKKIVNGNPVPATECCGPPLCPDKPCRVYCGSNFVGIGVIQEEELRLKAVFQSRT